MLIKLIHRDGKNLRRDPLVDTPESEYVVSRGSEQWEK